MVFAGFIGLSLYTWEGIKWGKAKDTPKIGQGFGRSDFDTAFSMLDTDDQDVFERAVYKMEQMGEAATNRLVDIMEDGDSTDKQRMDAIYVTGRMGKEALGKAEVPVMNFLLDNNPDLRAVSASALGKMKSKNSVSRLINLLDDEDEWVRKSAKKALENIGTRQARKAVKGR